MRKGKPDQDIESVDLGFELDYPPLKTILIFYQL